MFVRACVLLSVAAAAVGAPALAQGELPLETAPEQQQFYREKRSSYGTPYYAPAPCASAHIPTYLSPVHHAAYAPHYGYGIPAIPGLQHYREADEQEMMSFSDMDQAGMMSESMMQEHMPLGRYAYGAPAVPVAPHYGAAGIASAASGPAIGVFPGANTGGCSVPLLLTCSPSIRPGRIVKSSYSYGGAGDAYRGVDEQHLPQETHEALESHDQLAAHEANSAHLPLHQ